MKSMKTIVSGVLLGLTVLGAVGATVAQARPAEIIKYKGCRKIVLRPHTYVTYHHGVEYRHVEYSKRVHWVC